MIICVNWNAPDNVDLPIEVEVPDGLSSEEEILNYLSDKYDYLVNAWSVVTEVKR